MGGQDPAQPRRARLAQRRPEEARELLEDALEVFERDRNRYSEAQTLRAYGEVRGADGQGTARRR